MKEIPEDVWTAGNLRGRNLEGDTLAEVLGEQPALLVFARHLG